MTRATAAFLGLALCGALVGCATGSLEAWHGGMLRVDVGDPVPTRLEDWSAARAGDLRPGFEYVTDESATWVGVAGGAMPTGGFDLEIPSWAVVEYDTLDPADDVLHLTVRVIPPASQAGVSPFASNPIRVWKVQPPFPGEVEVDILGPTGAGDADG